MQYNKTADGTVSCRWRRRTWIPAWVWSAPSACSTAERRVYETDAFTNIIAKISELSGKHYDDDEATTKAFRIVADHLRTSTFIMGDRRAASAPANVDQGYVLRRLIRRAVRFGMELGMPEGFTAEIGKVVIDQYAEVYPELKQQRELRAGAVQAGRDSFRPHAAVRASASLRRPCPAWARTRSIDGVSCVQPVRRPMAFPIEMTRELAKEHGLTVDDGGLREALRRSIRRAARRALSSASRAAWRTAAPRARACIPRPTCFTRRCARCWATRLRRRAPTSRRSACASTSPSAAR